MRSCLPQRHKTSCKGTIETCTWSARYGRHGRQDRPDPRHYIERRDALEASANELFEVVAWGKVRINVNQRFALKDAADAHKALEERATSGSTVLTI
jgi:NADPH:quinone reductase-like Zn-dependent oxidoreductase